MILRAFDVTRASEAPRIESKSSANAPRLKSATLERNSVVLFRRTLNEIHLLEKIVGELFKILNMFNLADNWQAFAAVGDTSTTKKV